MCRTSHFALYEHIAQVAEATPAIKDAAIRQVELSSLQNNVNKVASTVTTPSKGNVDFVCSIYSMNNKDFEEHIKEDYGDTAILNPDALMKLPGILLRDTATFVRDDEADSMNDPCVDLTYNGFETVHTFYKSHFNRNSIDDKGLELRGTIHLSRGYDNAFWDPGHQAMFFGDGGRRDGRGWLVTDPRDPDSAHLTNWHAPYALEILGHELTHGVVAHTAALGHGQEELGDDAGLIEACTIDEHIADCFGIMIKQFYEKAVDPTSVECPWDLAPQWFSETAQTVMGWTKGYLRTFKPIDSTELKKQADQGPKHMKDLVPFVDPTTHKMGDPHINVGILNKAFYVAALAFSSKGPTWQTVGKIWYSALTDKSFRLVDNQKFKYWAALTTSWASQLYGEEGRQLIIAAWKEVGL